MLNLLSDIRDLLGYRVYLGRDPRAVGPGSIVLFPLLPDILSCGLTGIVKINKALTGPPGNAQEAADLFAVIRKAGLKEVFTASIPAGKYLLGMDHLKRLGDAICRWKIDENFREIFFDAKKAGTLGQLVGGDERIYPANRTRASRKTPSASRRKNWSTSTRASSSSKTSSGPWRWTS